MITRKDCEDLLAIAVQSPGADEVFVSLSGTEQLSRGVAGQVLQAPHRSETVAVAVTVRKGRRYAMASGNVVGERDVRELVARAASHAAVMPEVPEVLPFPAATDFLEVPLHAADDGVAIWNELHEGIDALRTDASLGGTLSYGSVSVAASVLALASSNGLFAYQSSRLGHAQFRCYSADGRSTGFNEQYRSNPGALSPAATLRDAAETCRSWQDAVEIAPKRITTIFEPRALADMLRPMLAQFSRRAIEQDRSFLRRLDGSSFFGTTLLDTRVTLRSDPGDPRLPSMPFTAEGQAVRAEYWVRNGVIAQLIADRFDAAKKDTPGKDASGAAHPTNLIMDVAEPVQDLVAGTEYGLLVKGFANLNIIDPTNCLLTGSTRDGVFLIEKGRITKPVRNLIIRETPVYLFKELLAQGTPEPTSTTGGYFPMLLPPIKVKDVMYAQLSGLI